MSPADAYAEWQKLCEEFEEGREANFQAFSVVNKKFAAIGQGTSRINPTDNELSEFERTRKVLEDVNRRMDEFVKAKYVSLPAISE